MKNLSEYINESILQGIENTLADGNSLNEPFDYIYTFNGETINLLERR